MIEREADGHDETGAGAPGATRGILCLVSPDLGEKLSGALQRFYADQPEVTVLIDRREGERRQACDRRRRPWAQLRPERERRRIHNLAGRRMGDRRARVEPIDSLPLPRKARPYADRISFVRRVEASATEREDVDTARTVARFQSGDRAAFAELYRRYFDRVYTHLAMVLSDRHEAEDVAQEVFIRVFRALPAYEFRPSIPVRAWLFRIVRNSSLKHIRKHNRVEVQEPGEIERRCEHNHPPIPPAALDWLSDRDLVVLIRRLPLAQRQALVLRYMLGFTGPEVAEILGISPGAARSLQHRALGFLKQRLVALGREPGRKDPGAHMRKVFRPSWGLRARRFALTRWQ